MNRQSSLVYSKPNLSFVNSPLVLLEQANNNYKKFQENQQNQSNLEFLQQNVVDLDEQIRMLEMQKQLETNLNKINIQFKDKEIQVYQEIIDQTQQQYNERQQIKEQKIRQLKQKIKETQNNKKLTEEKLESINLQIQEFKNVQSGKLILYLSNSQNSYRHNTCQTQAYLTNKGLIICDGNCKLMNKEVDHWYIDFEKQEVIYIDQPWQVKQYKFKMIFNEMIFIDVVQTCLDKNYIHGQARFDFISSIKNSPIFKTLEQQAN